jgi:hypothetical protein
MLASRICRTNTRGLTVSTGEHIIYLMLVVFLMFVPMLAEPELGLSLGWTGCGVVFTICMSTFFETWKGDTRSFTI